MDTPCVKICIYDPGRSLCIGCGRSLAEIAGWTGLGEAERRAIIADLPHRLEKLRLEKPKLPPAS